MLTSLLLGGLGFSGCGSRSFSSNASLMILNEKSPLAAVNLSVCKLYISDHAKRCFNHTRGGSVDMYVVCIYPDYLNSPSPF